MTFNDWSAPCRHRDSEESDCYYFARDVINCAENNCPRYDEYCADVEADAYEAHLLDKMQDRMDRS